MTHKRVFWIRPPGCGRRVGTRPRPTKPLNRMGWHDKGMPRVRGGRVRGSMAQGGSLNVVLPEGCERLGSGHQRNATAARMRWQDNDLPQAEYSGIAGVGRRISRPRTVIQSRMEWQGKGLPRQRVGPVKTGLGVPAASRHRGRPGRGLPRKRARGCDVTLPEGGNGVRIEVCRFDRMRWHDNGMPRAK